MAAFAALAGLAVATKEPVAALYVGIPVLLVVPRDDWRGYRDPVAVARMAMIGLASAFVAYALGSGMVLDPVRWKAHIDFAFLRTSDVAGGAVSFMTPYPWTPAGHWGLAREIIVRLGHTLTPPGLLLAAAGIVMAWRGSRRSTWLLVMAATYVLTLFLLVRAAQLRYVLPAGLLLAPFAGFAVVRLLSSAQNAARWSGRIAAAATVGVGLVWAVDLTHAMINDSRYQAGAWIASVAQPGDRLEYFGAFQKNPPLPRDMESGLAVEYQGGVSNAPRDDATAERIRAAWRERAPRFIVLTPDHTSRPGEPYAHSCPPQIFDDLEHGRIGYTRAHLFHTPPLIGVLPRPRLDYGAVNPEVRVYVRTGDAALRTGA
jgi:hypothetical protein